MDGFRFAGHDVLRLELHDFRMMLDGAAQITVCDRTDHLPIFDDCRHAQTLARDFQDDLLHGGFRFHGRDLVHLVEVFDLQAGSPSEDSTGMHFCEVFRSETAHLDKR